MGNCQIEKKYAIKGENGWSTPYEYDKVWIGNFAKSVIGIKPSQKYCDTVEGYNAKDGKKLFCIDKSTGCSLEKNYVCIEKQNKKYYIFFDENQKIVGPYNHVNGYEDYEIIVVGKDIKIKENNEEKIKTFYGIYNLAGNRLLDVKYDEIRVFSDSIGMISRKGKWGVFLHDCTPAIPVKYDDIMRCNSPANLVKVYSKTDNKYGLIYLQPDEMSKIFDGIALPVEYDDITEEFFWNTDIFITEKDSMYGICNYKGEEIFSPVFDDLYWIPKTPFINVTIGDQHFYYNICSETLFAQTCIKLCKGYYKYFDGKWHKVAYKK